MLIKSLACTLIVASFSVLGVGQTPEVTKEDADKSVKSTSATPIEKLRNTPFAGGVDLQFLIKELAREIELNVLFDPESFRQPRRAVIDLQNVTAAAALDYILLQEWLFFEEVGPKTIMVASQARRPNSLPQIGVGVTYLTDQLAQYFGVKGGILIINVRDGSSGSKAGLKAGDVIVEVDGTAVQGAFGLFRYLSDKSENDATLIIVRDRKGQAISVTLQKGLQ